MWARKPKFRRLEAADFSWFWAAYKKGDLEVLDDVFKDEMDQQELRWALDKRMGEGEWWVLLAPNRLVKGEATPVGFVGGKFVRVTLRFGRDVIRAQA